MPLGSGIPLTSSFDVFSTIPLDAREIAADTTARDAIPLTSRYIGMEVYCVTEDTKYKLVGGTANANWVAASMPSGTVVASQETDSTTTGANQTAALTALMRIFTNATLTSLAGITAPTSTKIGILVNRTGADITIINNATATAADRIITGTGSDLTVKNGAAVWVAYDTVEARWQVIGGSGSGGGGFNKIVSKTVSGTIAADEDCIVCTPAASMTLTLQLGVAKQQHNFIRSDNVEARTVTVAVTAPDQILTTLGLVTSVTIPYQGNVVKLVHLGSNMWGSF